MLFAVDKYSLEFDFGTPNYLLIGLEHLSLWYIQTSCPKSMNHLLLQLQYHSAGKNGLILPIGQWYAPSEVINDAW